MGGKVHFLKTWQHFFESVASGLKTFEIRFNDRNFQVGDVLVLIETVPNGFKPMETGRSVRVMVTYITDFAQKSGYVVMGIKLVHETDGDDDEKRNSTD